MSPKWIKLYMTASEFGDVMVDVLTSREDRGYVDPRNDNFEKGAEHLAKAIAGAALILPDSEESLSVLAELEGILDHLCNLADWQNDNREDCANVAA